MCGRHGASTEEIDLAWHVLKNASVSNQRLDSTASCCGIRTIGLAPQRAADRLLEDRLLSSGRPRDGGRKGRGANADATEAPCSSTTPRAHSALHALPSTPRRPSSNRMRRTSAPLARLAPRPLACGSSLLDYEIGATLPSAAALSACAARARRAPPDLSVAIVFPGTAVLDARSLGTAVASRVCHVRHAGRVELSRERELLCAPHHLRWPT